MSLREYRYVGSKEIAQQASAPIERLEPASASDLVRWLEARRVHDAMFTFVVDEGGALWVSDRNAEHVACARGRPVLAAGEIELRLHGSAVEVISVTNQSTGYCPEPACWPAVAAALLRIGIVAPSGFTHSFLFRRCTKCQTTNILKPEFPECPVCGDQLPAAWNLE